MSNPNATFKPAIGQKIAEAAENGFVNRKDQLDAQGRLIQTNYSIYVLDKLPSTEKEKPVINSIFEISVNYNPETGFATSYSGHLNDKKLGSISIKSKVTRALAGLVEKRTWDKAYDQNSIQYNISYRAQVKPLPKHKIQHPSILIPNAITENNKDMASEQGMTIKLSAKISSEFGEISLRNIRSISGKDSKEIRQKLAAADLVNTIDAFEGSIAGKKIKSETAKIAFNTFIREFTNRKNPSATETKLKGLNTETIEYLLNLAQFGPISAQTYFGDGGWVSRIEYILGEYSEYPSESIRIVKNLTKSQRHNVPVNQEPTGTMFNKAIPAAWTEQLYDIAFDRCKVESKKPLKAWQEPVHSADAIQQIESPLNLIMSNAAKTLSAMSIEISMNYYASYSIPTSCGMLVAEKKDDINFKRCNSIDVKNPEIISKTNVMLNGQKMSNELSGINNNDGTSSVKDEEMCKKFNDTTFELLSIAHNCLHPELANRFIHMTNSVGPDNLSSALLVNIVNSINTKRSELSK